MHVCSDRHLLFFSAELLEESFLFYHLGKPTIDVKQKLCKNIFSALLGLQSQKAALGVKQGRVQQEKPSWRSEM